MVQRVTRASVTVDGEVRASCGPGALILLGVKVGDTSEHARTMAAKLANLRIFRDEAQQMNLSLLDTGGEAIVVSQFTLYGDTRKGRRPSFVDAARPEDASPLCDLVASELRALGVRTGEGVFGAMMDVELVNDGPVTLIVDV